MKTCQKCKAEIERGDKYCPECGEKLVEEVRTITIWSILKVIIIIVFFIILSNVLKQGQAALSIVFLIFLILFILWTNILNWFLKKMFNAEVSTGVKMIITVLIIAALFFSASFKTAPSQVLVAGPQHTEGSYLFESVLRLSDVIGSRDYNSLDNMFKDDLITEEVFKDIRSLIDDALYRGDFGIRLEPQNQQTDDNKAKVDTLVFIRSGGVEKASTAVCLFERGERGWRLFAINPKLVDIKLSTSFEEEVKYKLKQVPKPVEAIAEVSQKNTYIKDYSKG